MSLAAGGPSTRLSVPAAPRVSILTATVRLPPSECSKAQANAAAALVAGDAAHAKAAKEEAEAKEWKLKAAEAERLALLADASAETACHVEQVKHNATVLEESQARAARESATIAWEAAEGARKELAAAKLCKEGCPDIKDAEALASATAAAYASKNADAIKEEAEAVKAKEAEVAAHGACNAAHIAATEAHGKAQLACKARDIEVAEAAEWRKEAQAATIRAAAAASGVQHELDALEANKKKQEAEIAANAQLLLKQKAAFEHAQAMQNAKLAKEEADRRQAEADHNLEYMEKLANETAALT